MHYEAAPSLSSEIATSEGTTQIGTSDLLRIDMIFGLGNICDESKIEKHIVVRRYKALGESSTPAFSSIYD